jgi:hydrogenase-4 component B
LTAGILVAGAGLIAAGIPLSALRGARGALAVQLAGAAVVTAGALAVLASGDAVGGAFHGGVAPRLGLDRLSALFALVVCGTAIPALLCARDQLAASPVRRPLLALTAAFLLSMLGVLAARDVATFLGSWELMTLVPATAILVARRDAAVRRAVFAYVAITHLGGAGVWVALLTLAHHDAFGAAMTGGPQALVLVAALVGFGTKAGVMPLHVWLPRAHPVAPPHVSALMSGVMLKVALYGLVRVLFEWAAPAPLWAGLVLLAAGVLSAVAGVLYALVQRELKRLLAFSSVENVGVIVAALGAAIVLADAGDERWAALAFAAALLHTLNHAAFKALLFLGAGAIGDAAGSLAFDRMGGLLRRMPWTGGAFLAGCAAIAAVPPLNGFASEWLTLQALLHVGTSTAPGISAAGALALAGIAVTAALAVVCFVKVVGLVLLGAPRTPQAAAATDAPGATRAALAVLAAACVALGVTPGLLVPTLVALAPGDVALEPGLTLAPAGTGGLAAAGLPLALALVFALVLRATTAAPRTAAAPAWTCGQRVEPALAWTSAGFTKPLRLALESVLRPERERELTEGPAGVEQIAYHAEVPHLFDDLVYRPVRRTALRGAAVARRVQSGSLRAYILYLLALVLGLLAVLRLGGAA